MAKVAVYNLEGKELEEINLSDAVFGLKRNEDLIHQVFVSLQANQRQILAHTKNRGERAGSGIKPWRQKGTGRARVGSVRSPLWKKGGVTFGPRKDRNFEKKINKKMKTKAIALTLSAKLRDGELIVVDKIALASKKTKEMAKALNNLKINKKTLMVFSSGEKDWRTFSRNVKKVTNILVSQLNVLDMLNNKYLLMSKESARMLEAKYDKK